MQVQIVYQGFPGAPDFLANLLDPEIVVGWGDPLKNEPNQIEVLVAGRPSLEQLRSCPKLQALVIPFAGIPAETRELLLDHFPGLPVYNLHHNAVATAEMAMALLLSVAKNLIPADQAIRRSDWRIRYEPNQNIILRGATALILGYGAVGREIARICHAFGMNVHAIRRSDSSLQDQTGVQIHTLSALDVLLPKAEVLFLALPHTPQTESLLTLDRLEKLPVTCILVNVGRAVVIEEGGLYEVLKRGSIAGAGIDVWYRYPQDEASREQTAPAYFPFHELKNIVMSPHRGGGSRQNEELRLEHLAQVINTLAGGGLPATRVDLRAGY